MLGCEISRYSKFDRKSYFYPDMPKNYQISQYDLPLCLGGGVEIEADGVRKTVRLTRIHLEEDVAKNMHFETSSGVDFNRAGMPLMEIVTEPDLASPEEAFAYLQALKQILLYAGVSDCNLEEGNMRCDVNCSVRPRAQPGLGTKTEIKNMNTFKGVLRALHVRAAAAGRTCCETGGAIVQETRRWDDATAHDPGHADQGGRARLPLLPRAGPDAGGPRPPKPSRPGARRCRSCPPRGGPGWPPSTGFPTTMPACWPPTGRSRTSSRRRPGPPPATSRRCRTG